MWLREWYKLYLINQIVIVIVKRLHQVYFSQGQKPPVLSEALKKFLRYFCSISLDVSKHNFKKQI